MPEPTPVTRSRPPFVAIAVWTAILAAIVAVTVIFGGPTAGSGNASDNNLGAGGVPAINFTATLAADPSASPGATAGASTAPGKIGDGDGGRKGPGGFAFGRVGRGGPGGHGGPGGKGGPGHGPISITAINGSQLSLKTDDGWTRTIDATGATITEQGGAAISAGDLKLGDQIGFRETRNADGTYKITDIVRIPPHAGGTVKSVDATTATVTLPDGTTKTIGLTGTTTYSLKGAAATAADVTVGTRIHAVGTVDGSGNFTATNVEIAPAEVAGTVTAKTATSITLEDKSGATVTVNVDTSTTYQTRATATAGLAGITVGNIVDAEGTLNADGSLKATVVRYGVAAPDGFGGRGPGFGPGKHGGPGFGPGKHGGPGRGFEGKPANPADPGSSPAPSAAAG